MNILMNIRICNSFSLIPTKTATNNLVVVFCVNFKYYINHNLYKAHEIVTMKILAVLVKKIKI